MPQAPIRKTTQELPHQTTVNDLLASEISAVEIYNRALKALADESSAADELRVLLADHQSAVDDLRRFARSEGEPATEDSGAWGLGARATQGVARLLGKKMILRALREGETHAQWKYENLVRQVLEPGRRHPSLLAYAARRSVILQEHIDTLERLLAEG